MNFHRPKPVALLFTLAALIVTLGLGTWQVQRLHWKTTLIADIAAANEAAPLTALPTTEAELKPLQFRKVVLKGQWVKGVEFMLVPRYFKSQLGYWIISPLKLADGRVLMVNRGWVPASKKEPAKRPETLVSGMARVSGMLRTGNERSYFTPANQPEKDMWFGRDVQQMGTDAKLDNVIPAMVDLVGVQDVKYLPVPSDGTIRIRNDHLSYILTWYGIALGILVIFIVYHRKK